MDEQKLQRAKELDFQIKLYKSKLELIEKEKVEFRVYERGFWSSLSEGSGNISKYVEDAEKIAFTILSNSFKDKIKELEKEFKNL